MIELNIELNVKSLSYANKHPSRLYLVLMTKDFFCNTHYIKN